jgi:hypothetical protein
MTTLNITTGEGQMPLPLEAQDFVGRRVAVLGSSGYGKTNTVATLIEELAPHIPMTIVDPEGEMWSLRERIDAIIVGRSENVDIEIEPHQAGAIATWSVEQGVTVVLDLFEYDDEEIEDVTQTYMQALWEACKRKKRPYHVVIEEADVFIPQPLPQKSIWKYVAKRGRKYGLGMILASQRSQVVDKNILTQCQLAFLHYVSHPRDMGIYKDLIPLKTREVETLVGSLRVGDAVVVNDGQIDQVHVRLRETHHPGSTPLLADDGSDTTAPDLKAVDGAALATLKRLIEAAGPPKPDPKIVALRKEIQALREDKEMSDGLIADLQSQVAAYQKHNERLQERIETLRLIKVEVQLVQPEPGQQPVAVAAGAEPPPTPKRTAPNHATRQRPLIQYEPDDSESLFAQRQRQELRKVARWCEVQPKQDQLVLRYLLTTGEQASLEDIAAAMAYSEQTLKSKPPIEMMNKGLIERSGKRGHHTYTASAARKFPHVDESEVKATILKHLATS